ncbi:MAG TPA: bifunctional DNA primase/polymerase [Polyangiaceae bacterium]|nr:bifunctional DNA primase/polymerase [Polyangiaceae bacterium]
MNASCKAWVDAALTYAARGWPVLPCHGTRNGTCACGRRDCQAPGKHPITLHGLRDATVDAAQIRRWGAEFGDANIAIRTGAESHLAVIDIDSRHSGHETWERLVAQNGGMPATVEALTGGAGRHVFLAHPGRPVRSRAHALGRGVDVKADGGYVIAAPSVHISGGTYPWVSGAGPEELEVAVIPSWLQALLDAGPGGQPKTPGARKAPVEKGCRNDHLASVAGKLRRRGFDEAMVLAALLEENRKRCDPPLARVEVEGIAHSVCRYAPPDRKSVTEQLVELASEAELFHAPDDRAFVTMSVAGHNETRGIDSNDFHLSLVHRFYKSTGKSAPERAVKEACNLLAARARFDGSERRVHVRIAEVDEAIYVDLGDDCWRAIKIAADGWDVVDAPPVRFIRGRGMGTLPDPIRGGQIAGLAHLLNLSSEDDERLVIAWMTACLRPAGPFPLLILQGEQGSAKSTTARMIRSLIDPNGTPLRSCPRDEHELMISAQKGWVMAFDNLSGLSIELSDALCRLSTGAGFSIRQLYTDAEEVLFQAIRPILLTSIDGLATRGDLADRSIVITLPRIADNRRRSEDALNKEFQAARAALFGALLDAASAALRCREAVSLTNPPRMADFALWGTAIENALAWPPGAFMRAYAANRVHVASAAVEGDLIASVICEFVDKRGEWEGTATHLMRELAAFVGDAARTRAWPTTPMQLSNRLRRLSPALRTRGVEVDLSERTSSRRTIRVRKNAREQRHERHERHASRERGFESRS